MEISGVRVKLIQDSGDRLKAVCTVTFDECFVVRDVKVVDGTNGLFVAMPSRKMSVHCPNCRQKNHLKALYCNHCGKSVPPPRAQADTEGRSRLHKDLAHPITPEFREIVQSGVLAAFHAELEQVGESFEQEPTVEASESRESHEPQPPRAKREPRKPRRSEPDHDMDDIQPLEVSEYDAIIADLKGGGPKAPSRSRDEHPPRRETPIHEEPVRESAAVAQQKSEPKPAPRPARPAEAKSKPRREPEPTAEAACDDSGGWPVFDDEPAEPDKVETVKTASAAPSYAPEPEPKKKPEPAAAYADADDDDEDDGGFGAGIL